MNIKHIKVGCEIFIINNGCILLGKRKNCYGEGTWALPGGHLEYGESLIECAKRELKEELGIDGIRLRIIAITDNINDRDHYVHTSFLLEEFVGEIRCMEPDLCFEWKFFDLSLLPEEIFKPHQRIIKTYSEQILYLD